jgi:hypothetical protein
MIAQNAREAPNRPISAGRPTYRTKVACAQPLVVVLLSPGYYSDSAAWCQKDRMRGGRRRMRRRARQAWWLS